MQHEEHIPSISRIEFIAITMSAAAEQKVKKLARLPGNIVCANCGASKQFGHSTVCIKFFTFVCSNCKSSHQAISHRCKSLTMSSWTDAEVAELEAKGNDYARNTWLKNAPPVGTGGRPKEGDHIDVFKRFVVDVYEHKKYYGEYSGAPPAATPQHVATAIPIAVPLSQPPITRPSHFSKAPVAAPAPKAPTADLLDFAAAPASSSFQADFDAFAPTAPPHSLSSTGFQADFATFATPAPAAPSNGSAFGFISQSAPPPATSEPPTSAFAFISNPPASNPAPSSNIDFADFKGLGIASPHSAPVAAPAPTLPKKPVMSANQKGSLISSMDNISISTPSKPQINLGGAMPQQGAFGGMPSNLMMQQQQAGFGGMNGTTMMQQQQQMMMMQQQQRMAMQQQSMGGMHNNLGMMNPGMVGGGMGIGMMTPQNMMGFGVQSNPVGNRNTNSSALNSLSMSGMDMSAWTSGKK